MIADEDGAASTLVDTHCHVHWPSLAEDVDTVIAHAREVGLTRLLSLGTDPPSSREAIAAAARYPEVYAAVGLHPGDITGELDADGALAEIAELVADPHVVAIGEVGLDYHHADGAPRGRQIEIFAAQLELAAACGKSICVHNRDATVDVMDVLKRYTGRVTAILHCFTGDRETADEAIAMGCYISFAGNVTYPKNRDLLAVAARVPLERLLIETDAPFLAPQPWRGRRNEPAYIVETYEAVAKARDMSRRALGDVVGETADRIFGWAV